jgi:putative phage-type endonuclease
MNIINCEQRSPEWFAVRLGVPTASEFDSIIQIDGKLSRSRQKYLYRLAGEKVAGKAEETYQNAAMLRGIELENEARQAYELIQGVEVEQVGFCLKDGYGCSPDGLMQKERCGLEIKCPSIAVHVGYLVGGVLPDDYFQQVQGSLLVTGYKWWDFMSYYPGLPPFIIRVTPDKRFLDLLENQLVSFCRELEETIKKIQG